VTTDLYSVLGMSCLGLIFQNSSFLLIFRIHSSLTARHLRFTIYLTRFSSNLKKLFSCIGGKCSESEQF
jgi:hypothetical protein